MDFHTIFSSDEMPSRRLVVTATVANRFAPNAGYALRSMREYIVRQIAQKCAENDDLVKITSDGPLIELRADCIVLTADELADLMLKQFRAGIEHATHFIPPNDKRATHEAEALGDKGGDAS